MHVKRRAFLSQFKNSCGRWGRELNEGSTTRLKLEEAARVIGWEGLFYNSIFYRQEASNLPTKHFDQSSTGGTVNSIKTIVNVAGHFEFSGKKKLIISSRKHRVTAIASYTLSYVKLTFTEKPIERLYCFSLKIKQLYRLHHGRVRGWKVDPSLRWSHEENIDQGPPRSEASFLGWNRGHSQGSSTSMLIIQITGWQHPWWHFYCCTTRILRNSSSSCGSERQTMRSAASSRSPAAWWM